MPTIRTIILFLTFVLSTSVGAYSADLVFVDEKADRDGIAEKVEAVCSFYGINFLPINAAEFHEGAFSKETKISRVIGGVIINARALPKLKLSLVLSAIKSLEKKSRNTIPVLITGFGQGTDELVRVWSGGAVEGFEYVKFLSVAGYRIEKMENLTFDLSGMTFGAKEWRGFEYGVFRNTRDNTVDRIIDIFGNEGGKESTRTVFFKSSVEGKTIYFHTGNRRLADQSRSTSGVVNRGDEFIEIIPYLLFVRHAFGEKCWHVPYAYANLTIDDPWLIEPYGDLRYEMLLKEMEKSNFHTTVAFIPWNYDRSTPGVITLFLQHKDRFSLSIHGNNHDHKEFYNKSKAEGEYLIRQALARMNYMSRNTGIAYDRVMIFPHEIFRANTLASLKKYNFLATVSWSGPKESANPLDPVGKAKSVTTKYENFPSVRRIWITDSAQPAPSDIATELFMNGFVIFCGHHDLFEGGMDSFNKYADAVNRIRPDVRWSGLGEIARHLYYQRTRDDGDVEVISYSSEMRIENDGKRKVVYHVRKEESYNPPIRNVLVDGRPYDSKPADNAITLVLEVLPGQSREIRIVYENDFDPAKIDTSKKGLRIYLLRTFSDFRDLVVSRNAMGRIIVKSYYKTGIYQQGLIIPIVSILVVAGSMVLIIRRLTKGKIRSGGPKTYH